MPRYFLNIHDHQASLDEDGMDLPDLQAAIREALKSVPAQEAGVGQRHAREQAVFRPRRP
jgi:hypothetical protein